MKHIDFTIDLGGTVSYTTSGVLVSGENFATRISALFPTELMDYDKYIIFHTKNGAINNVGKRVFSIEVLMQNSYFDIPIGLINAVIDEVSFRAINGEGKVFPSIAVAFPPIMDTLLPDSDGAIEPLLTGLVLNAGENILISESIVGTTKSLSFSLKRPLQNPIEICEVNGLVSALVMNNKADKVISAIENNFTTFDNEGNIKDSGKKASDFVNANTAITGATKTKITYDAKGLVTSGANATTSDISEGTNLYHTLARVVASSITATLTIVPSLINTLQGWINGLTFAIKGITGKTNWYDTPVKTLEGLNTDKVDKVTGTLTVINLQLTQTNLNNLKTDGLYMCSLNKVTNNPDISDYNAGSFYVRVTSPYHTGTYKQQMLVPLSDSGDDIMPIFYRHFITDWSDWQKISTNLDMDFKIDKATGYSLVLDTEIAKIHSLNADAETVTTIGTLINGATAKTAPVDADYIPLMDSEATNVMKKLSWAYIKSTLLTAFKNVANGVAGLDANSRIAPAQLPVGTFTMVAQARATGNAMVTFEGLDIQADGGMYHIEIYGTGSLASSILMYINGDMTGTNYRAKTGPTATNSAQIAIMDAVFTTVVLDLSLITLDTATRTAIAVGTNASLGATTISASAVSWAKISVINNITSITFSLNTESYLSSKTVITIWKKG